MLHHQPAVWRSQLKPFLNADTNSRSTARAEAKVAWSQFESSAHISGTEDISDKMTLTRVQFQAWTGFWEKLTTEAADRKFDILLQEQQGAHNDGGVEQVKYAGIKKERTRTGIEHRSGVIADTPITENEFAQARKRLRTKGADPFQPGPSSQQSPAASHADQQPPSKAGPRGGAAATSRGKKHGHDASNAHMDKIKTMAPSDLSSKQFMQRQDMLTAVVEEGLLSLKGVNGTLTSLNRFLEGVERTDANSELYEKGPSVVQSLKDCETSLNGFLKQVETVDAGKLIKLESDLHSSLRLMESTQKQALEFQDAFKYKQGKTKRRERQQYLHDHHQTSKLQGYLTTAGWGKLLAKFAAKRLFAIGILEENGRTDIADDAKLKVNPAEFQTDMLAVWRDPASNKVALSIAQACQDADTAGKVSAKEDRAELDMNKHKKWGGCMQLVKGVDLTLSALAEAADGLMEGAVVGPYMLTSRRWTYRFGPGSSPCSGVGMFLQPQAGVWAMTVVPVDKLLKLGIVITDMESFANTKAGGSFFEEESVTTFLMEGQVMWIPYGWALLSTLAKDAKTTSQACSLLCYQVYSQTLVKKLPDLVFNAIRIANVNFYKTKTESCWVQAAGDFEKLGKLRSD